MPGKKCVYICVVIIILFSLACGKEPKEISTGGWTRIEVSDINVLKGFAFLKNAAKKKHPKIELLKVASAKKQIVAGTKYKLTCEYQKGTEGTTHNLTAEIYVDLQGNHSLVDLKLADK